MKPVAVIFDLYRTLFVPNSYAPDREAAGTRYLTAFASAGLNTSGMNPETTLGEIWDTPVENTPPGLTLFESRLATFLGGRLQATLSPEKLRGIADRVCAGWQTGYHVAPDAENTLMSIRGRHRVSLLSNFDHPPHVRRALADTDLAGHFEDIIISDEVNLAKPDPEIMHLACNRLGVDPVTAVYVGDSYVDYQASTGAGMRFIWIRRPEADAASRTTPPEDNPWAETDEELRQRAAAAQIDLVESLGDILPLLA